MGKDMLGRSGAVTVEVALDLLLNGFEYPMPGTSKISISDALGRVISEDALAFDDLPSFDRSVMDGFAVRASDTYGATESSPCYLTVAGEVSMTSAPDAALKYGEAIRIPTGGMLPEGADAVLMLEHTQSADENTIEALRPVSSGENVLRRGDDVRKGEVLIKMGRKLMPADLSLLSSAGICSVDVYDRPRVAVISTGDEIVPCESECRPPFVRDSNSHMLMALLREDGAVPEFLGIAKDNIDNLTHMLKKSLSSADMVILSGGSSVGARDHAERVIGGMGRVLFHTVSIKPGKPLICAVSSQKPIFGLPGHPRAVSVCYSKFVRPVLHKMMGIAGDNGIRHLPAVYARLDRRVHSYPGRRDVIHVRIYSRDGRLWAEPLIAKSGVLSVVSRSHGYIEISECATGADRGDDVEVHLE